MEPHFSIKARITKKFTFTRYEVRKENGQLFNRQIAQLKLRKGDVGSSDGDKDPKPD